MHRSDPVPPHLQVLTGVCGKPDALSKLHEPPDSPYEPEFIVPPLLRSGCPDVAAGQRDPDPGGGPTNKLYVPLSPDAPKFLGPFLPPNLPHWGLLDQVLHPPPVLAARPG